ncbi:hypothetical protein ACHAQJ_006319 [Trichoderma viride]
MVGNTICGILMAVGHHLFYMSLDKQTVGNQNQQEWNVRIGTGMAFCVKMFLTAAAGFAYAQVLWKTLKAREVKLEGIDAMFDVAHNALAFTSMELWRKGFELVLTVDLRRAIPIIAVFTPATLTVEQAKSMAPSTQLISLPLVNFSSPFLFTRWSEPMTGGPDGPSLALDRLISSVAAQGAILPLERPIPSAPKVSYTMRFHGPSVSCGHLSGNSSFYDDYDKIFDYAINHQGNSEMVYLGFTPQSGDNFDTDYSYEHQALLGLTAATNMSFVANPTADIASRDHCRLFVIVTAHESIQTWSAAENTIECGLYNSTYEAQFTFANGTQEIDIHIVERGDGVSEVDINKVDMTNSSNPNTSHHNIYQLAAVYIMRGLGGVVTGVIRDHQGDFSSGSKILSSAFMQAKEMQAMLNSGFGDIATDPTNPPTNISLAQIMEQFVANVTSYGRSFSTVLRTTRNEELDRLLDANETSGAEPLSKHLAETRLKFWAPRHADDSLRDYSAFVLAQNKTPSYEELTTTPQDMAHSSP